MLEAQPIFNTYTAYLFTIAQTNINIKIQRRPKILKFIPIQFSYNWKLTNTSQNESHLNNGLYQIKLLLDLSM
jgi:hypothetical protein